MVRNQVEMFQDNDIRRANRNRGCGATGLPTGVKNRAGSWSRETSRPGAATPPKEESERGAVGARWDVLGGRRYWMTPRLLVKAAGVWPYLGFLCANTPQH